MLEKPTTEYEIFLLNLKKRIQQTQVKAALAVSQELVVLYWSIGQDIVKAQQEYTWGDKVLEQIAKDLKAALPAVTGFSKANLYRMRAFYITYPDDSQIIAQLARQLPWGHNIVLLEKIKDQNQRLWYANQTLETRNPVAARRALPN
jgi:predicted nuclease of restriction endonuclease-like (RecB) superfamily